MGQAIKQAQGDSIKSFTQALLRDLKALEIMLEKDMFETGVVRIGSEQELCLIDRYRHAAPYAMEILDKIDDDQIVNEFARFNLEVNASPQLFSGDCFARMTQELKTKLALIRNVARGFDVDLALVGILPTLRQRDLVFDNMTPLPRYERLDAQLRNMRGGNFSFSINGTDELLTHHPSALLESCNTSFQVHLQVPPAEFVARYNMAQMVTGPLLAASSNSSLFFGKRLWKETRIALFQQSIDTRRWEHSLREESPRVTFGRAWLKDSVLESYQDDLSRFRLLIHEPMEEDSLKELEAGRIPKLRALCLFNGTVYRWNRACYGISQGKPHLRIECRVLPSGPTVLDEMANAAFWLGMVQGMTGDYENLHEKMSFDHAAFNFYKAAKMGLDTDFTWLDDRVVSASELILDELLPMARKGLANMAVDEADSDKLLGIIEERVKRRHTGSMWLFESFNQLLSSGNTRYEAAVAVTAAMVNNQLSQEPVHLWKLASREKAQPWLCKYLHVEQIMTTELYTVGKRDLVELATHMMQWKRIRHVPVEDENGKLVGMVTAHALMKHFTSEPKVLKEKAVEDVMLTDLTTISPDTPTLEALELMKTKQLSCLPVLDNQKLVGMVTEFDFARITAKLLETLTETAHDWREHPHERPLSPSKEPGSAL